MYCIHDQNIIEDVLHAHVQSIGLLIYKNNLSPGYTIRELHVDLGTQYSVILEMVIAINDGKNSGKFDCLLHRNIIHMHTCSSKVFYIAHQLAYKCTCRIHVIQYLTLITTTEIKSIIYFGECGSHSSTFINEVF